MSSRSRPAHPIRETGFERKPRPETKVPFCAGYVAWAPQMPARIVTAFELDPHARKQGHHDLGQRAANDNDDSTGAAADDFILLLESDMLLRVRPAAML